MAPTTRSPVCTAFWTALAAAALGACASALDYASNLTASPGTTTAALAWTAPSDPSAVGGYTLSVLRDGGATLAGNHTLSDPSAESYDLTGLEHSTYYTARLHTVSSGGGQAAAVVGVTAASFWTGYDVWNPRFFAALGVVAFMVLALLAMLALKSVFLGEGSKDQDGEAVLDDLGDLGEAGPNGKGVVIF